MANTNLIIKNTITLYLRSFISLFLSLYTSRLILEALGIEGYGVYQAVGGVVTIFSFIQTSLASATQRFISYNIGVGDQANLNRVFTMCVNVHLLLSLILVVIVEVFGLWYIDNKLDYGKVDPFIVKLVFHTSVAGLFFIINNVPYHGLIIAREAMSMFAYLDIFSRFLKFALAIVLLNISANVRLLLFALVILGINILVFLIYFLVCKKKYTESQYILFWDVRMFKELLSFSWWVTLPSLVSIFKTQGMLVVLNTTFGPVMNAAQGVSNQVNNAIKSFANNAGLAFSPQIAITYAQRDYKTMENLFILGSKITFFLFAFMAFPLCCEMNFVLSLWLKEVPQYTNVITVLVLVDTLISSMTSCYNTAIRATGNIKYYEFFYNLFHLAGLVFIIILIKMGCSYYIPYLILAVWSFISMPIQFYCMKRVMPFIRIKTIITSIMQMTAVILLSIIPLLFIKSVIESSFLRFSLVLIVSILSIMSFAYLIGFSKNEREKAVYIVKKKFKRSE